MKCQYCGSELAENAKFCTNCGAKIEEVQEVVNEVKPVENNNDKFIAILSYLGALVVVPIIKMNESDFIKFHANQGLVLLITWFVINVIFGVLNGLLGWINILTLILNLSKAALSIGYLVLCVIGIKNAYDEVRNDLPLIGKIRIL